MKQEIKSKIEFFYLIPFICKCTEINQAINFIETKTNNKIKISNFTRKINLLIEKKYLILLNNPNKTKYSKKILKIDQNIIIKDIVTKIKDVTKNYTYEFKIDGKKIIKQKNFLYNKQCQELEKQLFINKNKDFFISIFSKYLEIILLLKTKNEKITRKSENFSYNEIIEQFINGFALQKNFIDEYFNYIDQNEIIIYDKKRKNKDFSELILNMKKVFRNYLLIKSSNINALYAGLIINEN
jgi:hypothetical protein